MTRISTIQSEVCTRYGIHHANLVGPCREVGFVRPRFVAMSLINSLPNKPSLSQIGRNFGQRDHSTVKNAIKQVDKWRADADFDREYRLIEERIHSILKPRVLAQFTTCRKGDKQ